MKLTKYDREQLSSCYRMLRSALDSLERVQDEERAEKSRELALMNVGACAEWVAGQVTKTQDRLAKRDPRSGCPICSGGNGRACMDHFV